MSLQFADRADAVDFIADRLRQSRRLTGKTSAKAGVKAGVEAGVEADTKSGTAGHAVDGRTGGIGDGPTDGIGDGIADRIADAIVDEWGQHAPGDAADSTHRAIFRPTRWVIRNQDLGLLDAVTGVLQGTATGAALFASTGSLTLGLLTPAIAVVTHLVKIAMNLRKKGTQLSEPEFFLLALVVERPDGASLDVLRGSWTARYGEPGASGVEALLEHLAKYPSPVGDLSFLWKGSDGRWRAKDL